MLLEITASPGVPITYDSRLASPSWSEVVLPIVADQALRWTAVALHLNPGLLPPYCIQIPDEIQISEVAR